jgi:hypothetical protein
MSGLLTLWSQLRATVGEKTVEVRTDLLVVKAPDLVAADSKT